MPGILSNTTNNQMPPGIGGMSGPSGKWISPRTGKTVLVKDTFIDGEHMNVMLSNGSIIPMNDFSRDYIQMSDEEYDSNGSQISANSIQTNNCPMIDESLLFKGMGDAPTEVQVKNVQQPLLDSTFVENYSNKSNIQTNTTNSFVDKILDKNDGPKLNIKIEWSDFPRKELQMLKDYFDVNDDSIVESIINKYVNIDSIKEAMESTIQTLLENKTTND